MMGKGTDVGMRQQWGVSWLPWCRLHFIVTTGRAAVAKNSNDIYSKNLSTQNRSDAAKNMAVHLVIQYLGALFCCAEQKGERKSQHKIAIK